MNFTLAVVALFSVLGRADALRNSNGPKPARCEFCLDGLTVEPDFELPTDVGGTCGTAMEFAATLDPMDDGCSTLKLAQALCCPPVNLPETTGAPPTEAPCTFCPGGLTVESNFELPTDDGATCGTAMGFAATLSPSDVMCPTVKLAQALCCPTVNLPEITEAPPTNDSQEDSQEDMMQEILQIVQEEEVEMQKEYEDENLSENGSSTTACNPKCFGPGACTGVNESKVGCGSCLGDMACNRYTGDSIGENSCRGPNSCMDATATIGKNSCNDDEACRGATGYIKNDQCNNSEDECAFKHFPALSLYKVRVRGSCRSSLGKLYSDVRIATTYLSEDSPEACAQFCRQPSLINGFQVGMQFGNNICFCKYDGSSELPSLVPDGAVKRVTTDGYGPVSNEGKGRNMKCYPLKDENVAHPSLNEPA